MAIKPVKVSQLNSYIKRILITDPLLGNVSVIGEVSNLKYHSSGHVYFSLKDDSSRINCFLAASYLQKLRYPIEEGMEITALGYVSVYEPSGQYSLNIKDIEVEGEGNLNIAFKKLKEKLEKEGLFKDEYKKKIPLFPKNIGIVTSDTGAAYKDIVKIITGKNDFVNILIYPVLVQGASAASDIASAIKDININYTHIDTIIVGRGGGSAEDLWAFNEEVVVRAIFESKIPIISAVGHEIDVTLSDFVADLRGETPTAAANIAVPDTKLLREDLKAIKESLTNTVNQLLNIKNKDLEQLNLQIFGRIIQSKIESNNSNIKVLSNKMILQMERIIKEKEFKIKNLKDKIEALSPVNTMSRGYSAIMNNQGVLIGSIEDLKENDEIALRLSDGEAIAVVKKIRRYKND